MFSLAKGGKMLIMVLLSTLP